ncbi:MAG: pyridoxamine 5'-phosphate oxidase family protein, partial [Akkermansia sp.]|nr:pyridoxamine 5'-phosphate oxidase family protein [Akkermansia sp.]
RAGIIFIPTTYYHNSWWLAHLSPSFRDFFDAVPKFIYMHCAPQGYKLECLAACSAVSLVITGAVRTLPHMFSTAYESLVVQGECLVVEDAAEKRNALHLLLRKYTPEHLDRGYAYAERALEHTTVLRLCISTWCGKAHLARS